MSGPPLFHHGLERGFLAGIRFALQHGAEAGAVLDPDNKERDEQIAALVLKYLDPINAHTTFKRLDG